MICKICESEKANSDFYKNDKTCKECRKQKVRKNRLEKIEYYREYDRARGCRQSPEYLANYRSTYPNKYKAHQAVQRAVSSGKMKKGTSCQECGSGFSVHAHHDDYSFPLSVRWLCAACHKNWHTLNGEAANP